MKMKSLCKSWSCCWYKKRQAWLHEKKSDFVNQGLLHLWHKSLGINQFSIMFCFANKLLHTIIRFIIFCSFIFFQECRKQYKYLSTFAYKKVHCTSLHFYKYLWVHLKLRGGQRNWCKVRIWQPPENSNIGLLVCSAKKLSCEIMYGSACLHSVFITPHPSPPT